jgi:uncharacterized membrane protein
MSAWDSLAKMLLLFGALMMLLGASIWLLGRLPGIGHLPGDIVWRKGNVTVYIPLASMILISILLTVVLNLLAKLWR